MGTAVRLGEGRRAFQGEGQAVRSAGNGPSVHFVRSLRLGAGGLAPSGTVGQRAFRDGPQTPSAGTRVVLLLASCLGERTRARADDQVQDALGQGRPCGFTATTQAVRGQEYLSQPEAWLSAEHPASQGLRGGRRCSVLLPRLAHTGHTCGVLAVSRNTREQRGHG